MQLIRCGSVANSKAAPQQLTFLDLLPEVPCFSFVSVPYMDVMKVKVGQFKSNTLQVLHYIHRGLNLHWFSVSSDAIPVMDICMINVLGNV